MREQDGQFDGYGCVAYITDISSCLSVTPGGVVENKSRSEIIVLCAISYATEVIV